MGLLKSVDDVSGIDYYEYRDSQYYNNYDYRLRFNLPGVKYTWFCKTPDDLDKKLLGQFNSYGNVRKGDKDIVIKNLPALKSIIDLQKQKKNKGISLRIERESVAVFSNDLQTLQDIEQLIGSNYTYDYTQVQTSPFAGVKVFANEPKYKYRVYLKTKRVDDEFYKKFNEMVRRTKSLHPSRALVRWMTRTGKHYNAWSFRWTSSAHFIDYDDESTLSYLALMYGEVLGKKYKLEKQPDPV